MSWWIPDRNDLVFHYRFDEADPTYTVKDYSYFGYNGLGNEQNHLVSTAGYISGARQFTLATSSRVEVGANQTNSSFVGGTPDKPFSFLTWIKPTTVSKGNFILGKFKTDSMIGEYAFQISSSNNFQAILLDQANSGYILNETVAIASDNLWQYVGFTYSGSGTTSDLKLYINGSLASMTTSQVGTYSGMVASNLPLFIGIDSSKTILLDAILDDTRLYRKEISSEAIVNLYNGAPQATSSGTHESGPTYEGVLF